MPTGFSRGQAQRDGRLRTASRRSNANPTAHGTQQNRENARQRSQFTNWYSLSHLQWRKVIRVWISAPFVEGSVGHLLSVFFGCITPVPGGIQMVKQVLHRNSVLADVVVRVATYFVDRSNEFFLCFGQMKENMLTIHADASR
jgi:hypothetical protein